MSVPECSESGQWHLEPGPATFQWMTKDAAAQETVFTLTDEADLISDSRSPASTLLKCPDCHRSYSNMKQLEMHQRQHSKENHTSDLESARFPSHLLKAHSCGLCQKRLWSSVHLDAHIKTMHTNEKPVSSAEFQCSQCPVLSFPNNAKLLIHVEQEHAFQCPADCSEHFPNTNQLAKHFYKVHNDGCVMENGDDGVLKQERGVLNVTQTVTSKSPKVNSQLRVFPTELDMNQHSNLRSNRRSDPKKQSDGQFQMPSLEEMLKMEIVTPPDDDCIMEVLAIIPGGKNPYSKSLRNDSMSTEIDSENGDEDSQFSSDIEFSNRKRLGKHKAVTLLRNEKHLKHAKKSYKNKKIVYNGVHSSTVKEFRCPQCPKTYSIPDSVQRHCRTVHSIPIFTCKPCVEIFTSVESKQIHKAKMHTNKFFPDTSVSSMSEESEPESESGMRCPWCERSYDVKSSLRSHCKKVHGKKVFICRECPALYHSPDERKIHMERDHMDSTSIDEEMELSQKEISDTSIKNSSTSFSYQPLDCEFGCDICQIEFETETDLQAHRDEHHPFKCPLCVRRYKFSKGLRHHFRHHHHSNALLYICNQCSVAFVKETLMKNHICTKSKTVNDDDLLESRSDSPVFHGFEQNDILKTKQDESLQLKQIISGLGDIPMHENMHVKIVEEITL